MNLVESKLRNRLGTKTIRALLTVRRILKRVRKSSNTFKFPVDVLKATGISEVYLPSDKSITEHADGSTSSSQNPECENSIRRGLFSLVNVSMKQILNT